MGRRQGWLIALVLVLALLAGLGGAPARAAEQADLLILCPDEFRDACQPLKEHKDATGLPTLIMDWRIAAQNFPQGKDLAEQLKLGIDYFRKHYGIKYVLLMGDASKLPVRYLITDRPQDNSAGVRVAEWAYYPVDLYYAALYKQSGGFDDWNANGDDYVGELHGERLTGKVNVDQVNYLPTVAVGRVPASTVSEVTTYVNKVIAYENGALNASWSNGVLLATSSEPDANYCKYLNNLAGLQLLGMDQTLLYNHQGTCSEGAEPTSDNIVSAWNGGLGLVAYMGHGFPGGWNVPDANYWWDLDDLNHISNYDSLPVVFAMACDTGRYAPLPPYTAYTDLNGVEQAGTLAGATYSTTPPLPACLQETQKFDCMAESILFRSNYNGSPTGAVAYIGCVTGSQSWGGDLMKHFFATATKINPPPTGGGTWGTGSLDFGISHDRGEHILGDAWNQAIERYYQQYPDPGSIAAANWHVLATFHTPMKYHLFGDPSLRLGGISEFEREDFEGAYQMAHDAWLGNVTINASQNFHSYPDYNLDGTWTSQVDGGKFKLRGRIVSRFCYQPQLTQNNQVELFVDFAQTDSTNDDQRFLGYLFGWTRDAIAGIYYWNGHPYGFYLIQGAGGSSHSTKGDYLVRDYTRQDFVGSYEMNHDGWRGTLQLWAQEANPIEGVPPLAGLYTASDGTKHNVRGIISDDAYPQPDSWGPRTQIKFYIDFEDNWDNTDDQEFVGYLCGANHNDIAGECYWHGRTFGFYALR